ncbi:cell division protein DedD [Pantoea eucalypti]|uniref:Cell division protein DedD n=1 Tax=Pantoea eucalypti TaxID=470933 RepID=A0ABY2ZHC7_9GAMM|nr:MULTISPECIES: cell division protein DedD [Pantoea]MBD9551982.1 cell division protein DedD [Pantoea sp. PNT01]MCD2355100.1 cell division protein DedD [Pantoea sp. MHSD4]PQL29343.1 cell division protein DedD [Pantoea ananatis]AWP32241.1 cell division protein DedD [Pantoea vagans]EFM18474.1 Sporulation domain protein [Pantoea sp. aB]
MASKFQNRLVGTVILVAVGVIVLPGLLDGQKKHYKEEFAAIPLVPKPDDQQDSEMVPPVTQSLPSQPPEGAGNAVNSSNGNSKSSVTAEQGRAEPDDDTEPTVVSPPPVHQSVPAQTVTKPKVAEQQKTKVTEQPKQKPVEQQKPKAVEQTKPKPEEPPKAVEQPKQEAAPKAAETTAPAGQAYVVQLGALKNASKVNEIVAQLRLSGYRAFTVPSTPVQGQITRIYVGPDASKAKMQSAVGELKSISGLGGVVKPYSAR